MAGLVLKETFRKMLHEKREEFIRSSLDGMKKFMSGESRRTLAAGQEEGDCSVSYQLEHMSCRQFETERENIRKIDLALQRLEEGSYGYCEECGEEIGLKRLKAIPFALLCRDCQETKEREPVKRN